MTEILDERLIPPLERVIAVLSDYDLVTQQKLIELATVRHVLGAGKHAEFVAKSVHKHVGQLLKQHSELQSGRY